MAGRGDLPSSGFGAQLRLRRDEKGWTQKQLAEASGIHTNTIARLERGEHEPAWPLVLALAKALGVSCEAFSEAQPGASEESTDGKPATEGKPAAKPATGKKPPAKKGKK